MVSFSVSFRNALLYTPAFFVLSFFFVLPRFIAKRRVSYDAADSDSKDSIFTFAKFSFLAVPLPLTSLSLYCHFLDALPSLADSTTWTKGSLPSFEDFIIVKRHSFTLVSLFLPLTPSQLNRVPCIMVPIHKTTPSILEQSLYHPSLQIVQPRPLQQAHDQHSDSHQLLKIHYVSTHHRAL